MAHRLSPETFQQPAAADLLTEVKGGLLFMTAGAKVA